MCFVGFKFEIGLCCLLNKRNLVAIIVAIIHQLIFQVDTMTNKTVLHAKHLASGAKMVDFHGWEMPINYGSQIEEHNAVRQNAGMFDVSHMTIVDVQGNDAKAFLRR